MVGLGRDLCGSSSPTPLTKHGHLDKVAQGLVQVGFEYLQRRRYDRIFIREKNIEKKTSF